MNAPLSPLAAQSECLDSAIHSACSKIAPTWPLDRFIAVNPYWGFVGQPIEEASLALQQLTGSPMLMPANWFCSMIQKGQIDQDLLDAAAHRHGLPDGQALLATYANAPIRLTLPLVTDAIDAQRDLAHELSCKNIVIHGISQFCAAHFDDHQARWKPAVATGLYEHWQSTAAHDRGPALLSGIPGITSAIDRLPRSARALIGAAVKALDLAPGELEPYFTALLFSVNGWAAWCAYQGWQARLAGSTDDTLEALLAIRLAWDWILHEQGTTSEIRQHWRDGLRQACEHQPPATASPGWVLQEALEATYQRRVNGILVPGITDTASTPALIQAVFCIDVRSEVFRRALEATHPSVETLGFAGFFGLPIDYTPLGTNATRPQLPGLLAPALHATDTIDRDSNPSIVIQRRDRLTLGRVWESFQRSAVTTFPFVETLGLGYAFKLAKETLGLVRSAPSDHAGLQNVEACGLRPVLLGLDLAQSVDLAAKVLEGLSLTRRFAPLVLLVGHGSSTRNNPHAAGLDCGACCGQTGEVNARLLAQLLNHTGVRQGLAERSILIPEGTRFVAALHDTTTDEVALFDLEGASGSAHTLLETAGDLLASAGKTTRRERATALGLDRLPDHQLLAALQQRSQDWSQVRPEWGLANNAAFIAAPRSRTRALNLEGRSFLHEYRAAEDPAGKVLELIMTAPLVVAHWINLQYYASVVDPVRFGSGNKVLHNVVGGHIGVFEGNGGDLRIGLPLQSVHDGWRWVHTPQRLSVWIEASQEAIDRVLNQHSQVRSLVEGQWIHLHRIEPSSGLVFRCNRVHSDEPGSALVWTRV